ncbi:MAG: hypothetical protein J3Q66DRAFT_431102, partial [Benniella sp.]
RRRGIECRETFGTNQRSVERSRTKRARAWKDDMKEMNDKIDDTHNMAEETQDQLIELKDTVRVYSLCDTIQEHGREVWIQQTLSKLKPSEPRLHRSREKSEDTSDVAETAEEENALLDEDYEAINQVSATKRNKKSAKSASKTSLVTSFPPADAADGFMEDSVPCSHPLSSADGSDELDDPPSDSDYEEFKAVLREAEEEEMMRKLRSEEIREAVDAAKEEIRRLKEISETRTTRKTDRVGFRHGARRPRKGNRQCNHLQKIIASISSGERLEYATVTAVPPKRRHSPDGHDGIKSLKTEVIQAIYSGFKSVQDRLGEVPLELTLKLNGKASWKHPFLGPYKIRQKMKNDNYQLALPSQMGTAESRI